MFLEREQVNQVLLRDLLIHEVVARVHRHAAHVSLHLALEEVHAGPVPDLTLLELIGDLPGHHEPHVSVRSRGITGHLLIGNVRPLAPPLEQLGAQLGSELFERPASVLGHGRQEREALDDTTIELPLDAATLPLGRERHHLTRSLGILAHNEPSRQRREDLRADVGIVQFPVGIHRPRGVARVLDGLFTILDDLLQLAPAGAEVPARAAGLQLLPITLELLPALLGTRPLPVLDLALGLVYEPIAGQHEGQVGGRGDLARRHVDQYDAEVVRLDVLEVLVQLHLQKEVLGLPRPLRPVLDLLDRGPAVADGLARQLGVDLLRLVQTRGRLVDLMAAAHVLPTTDQHQAHHEPDLPVHLVLLAAPCCEMRLSQNLSKINA